LNRRKNVVFLLAMTDAICAPEGKKRNSENCTTSTGFFVVIFFFFMNFY